MSVVAKLVLGGGVQGIRLGSQVVFGAVAVR